jgi:hypothetical protein
LLCLSRGGAPGGGAVVRDVAPLEALLTPTFSIGLDVGRGREKVPWSGCGCPGRCPAPPSRRRWPPGALVIERGVATEQIAAAGGLALHAAAFNGIPDGAAPGRPRDGRGHRPGRARTRPARPGADVLLDAAPQAAAGLQQLLAFRHDCTTVTTPAEQAAAAGLTSAAAELGQAAEALHGLIELAEMTGRSGRAGKTDLS